MSKMGMTGVGHALGINQQAALHKIKGKVMTTTIFVIHERDKILHKKCNNHSTIGT